MHRQLYDSVEKESFMGTKEVNFDHQHIECDQKTCNGKNFRRNAYVN